MLSIINSSTVIGIEGIRVKVEVDINKGIPCFNIVGLAGTSIKESRERVKSAIINSGYKFPNSRIVVNLSPADMKKEGPLYDLPILIALLCANGQLTGIDDTMAFIGELSLDGTLRRINGVLPMVLCAKKKGIDIPTPKNNAQSNANNIPPINNIDLAGMSKQLESLFKDLSANIKMENIEELSPEDIEELEEEVKLHDPFIALDGKEDGLYFYRKIVEKSPAFLKNGGKLYFEIGHDQGEDVKKLMEDAGFSNVSVKKDLAGLDRVVFGEYNMLG